MPERAGPAATGETSLGEVMTVWVLATLIGLTAGLLSALLGVGGGLIMVPALVLFMGLDMHRAVGTSLGAMLPIVVVGLARHYGFGNVDLKTALLVAAGGVAGAAAGAGLSDVLPALVLKRLFGGLILVVALRMLLGR